MATRKDVAKLAGVSPALVSYYINGNGYVGKESRERIKNAIEELDYTPNLIAKSLKENRTNQLLLLCNEIRNPFHSELVFRMNNLAFKKGYVMLFSNIINDVDHINKLCSYQVDGVMIVSDRVEDSIVNKIVQRGIPTVLMSNKENVDLDKRVLYIKIDAGEAVKALVDHVVSRGHKKIAWISSASRIPAEEADGKTRGFLEGLKANGIEYNPKYLIFDTADAMKAYIETRDLMDMQNGPTAFICANDAVAKGVIRVASELGKRVPEDIAVTGFDNTQTSKLSVPSITTVDIGTKELSMVCFNGLVDKVERKAVENMRIKCGVIIRESS